MKKSAERDRLRIVRDPEEEQRLRFDIQSLMERTNTFLGYTCLKESSRGEISSEGILSFPMPFHKLREIRTRLEERLYRKGDFSSQYIMHVFGISRNYERKSALKLT